MLVSARLPVLAGVAAAQGLEGQGDLANFSV